MTAGTKGAWYTTAKKKLLDADLDLLALTIRASLIDLADEGIAISGATAATPSVITATSHGLATGDRVQITGITGMTGVLGTWVITVINANTFSLDGSVGGGTYAAAATGAWVVDLEKSVVGDIDAVAFASTTTPLDLGSKTTTGGKFDAADGVIAGAAQGGATTPTMEALLFHVSGGTEHLAFIITEGTGLPVTVGGGDVNVTFPGAYIARI